MTQRECPSEPFISRRVEKDLRHALDKIGVELTALYKAVEEHRKCDIDGARDAELYRRVREIAEGQVE